MGARRDSSRRDGAASGHAAEAALAGEMAAARACTLCSAHLPLGPRPVLRGRASARVLIVGQAPGTRVHASGTPWDDPSGDRLRAWLGLGRAAFYDEARIAILPIGLCYPGRLPRGGDAPPRPECAPLWHPRLRPLLARLRLTLLVGSYAQAFYLGARRGPTLAATVRDFARYAPDFFPLPHPSWRTRAWAARHAWFEAEVIPAVRRAVAGAMAEA